MGHIKKMIIQGFKSFARKTEIEFDKEINLFVGPNGSGKTNVAEALTFVLGRLSIKSMRAAKAKNLIFMGSKYIKPSKEALVELMFDNTDRAFSIDKDEISLKRIVRHNGQSMYKINNETKTRTEVIEMLAQAGIDPYGFNLIMQGQIQGIVKMHPEERRKIIEEVAGISIYESRKEKSIRELEKTDERLKEISTILRERTSYLKNLEKEKEQAQKYKDSQLIVKRAKATILSRRMKDKEREIEGVIKGIETKNLIKEKVKKTIEDFQGKLNELSEKINEINKHIQKSSGLEQESLHNDISNLKAELEGAKVRKESYENRQEEVERRIEEMSKTIPEIEAEISELRKKSPLMAKKSEELKKKKEELAEIEAERKRFLTLRKELEGLKERTRDKEKELGRIFGNSELLLERIEEEESKISYPNQGECVKSIEKCKNDLLDKKNHLEELSKNEIEKRRIVSISDFEIEKSMKIISDVKKLDLCPLCQSKITEEHIKHVNEDCENIIRKNEEEKKNAIDELKNITASKLQLEKEISETRETITKGEIELVNQKNLIEKKEQLKAIVENQKLLKEEISELEKKRKSLEEKSSILENIEEKYERKILEIEEISSRTEIDVDTTLLYKERELENIKNIIKRGKEDLENIELEISEIIDNIELKSKKLDDLIEKENKLQEKFKKLFEERDNKQKNIQEFNLQLNESQNESRQIEDQVNYLKIGKAKLDAEHEAIEMEITEFSGVELLQGSVGSIEDRLRKAQEILQNIGAINMRALEVYVEVKKEYEAVFDKVETLQKEKEDIMKIIEEIDRKKKKTFMKTFAAINSLFTENFSKLSSKGLAYLEVENKEDIFSGGINIVVKLAKGKYFDVTSLSGGEQTLVALSLLFAIQEHKPYHFYVFDEIDAALDKRNSERLAGLLNQYMKAGQYIVITHNDALITNSNVLYGVSMHEGVSKILSLRLNSEKKTELISENQEIVGSSEIKGENIEVLNEELDVNSGKTEIDSG